MDTSHYHATVTSPRPRVGLLALTLELYEQLAPGLRAAARAVVATSPCCLRWPPAPTSASAGRSIAARTSRRSWPSTSRPASTPCWWSSSPMPPARSCCRRLQRTRLPMVVWNTQELLAVDESFDGQDAAQPWRARDAGPGQRAVAQRRAVPLRHVARERRRRGCEELVDFFQAAAAVARLRSCRLGLMGYPFPGMGDLGL